MEGFRPENADITQEMWTRIDAIIDTHRDIAGAVITVLRECQDVVGYLPVELIDYISAGLNVSKSEVFGVASFYALFSFVPKGRHLIKVCMGTACYVKGIKETMDRISATYDVQAGGTSPDRRFSLEPVRCLGACGLAPVIAANGEFHAKIQEDDVKRTVRKLKKGLEKGPQKGDEQ